ncbi:hypothetical protein BISA_0579 [Bifidobacterium saguini DSM 23967]|uniref:Uncharacterized protein n=3 Tax=Bifidobacterium saguini TaxID=762210 RepID=A0A087D9I3_9BIFI|nr:hypothetical protein BISA_0579 [Bifidobacterium saguini DSM 23967]
MLRVPLPNMMLRIDSDRLQTKLQERREFIGFVSKATHGVALVEGFFLILSAFTAGLPSWLAMALGFVAVMVTLYSLVGLIITWRKGYNAEELYQELKDMDRTEKHSSIIAINDGNRYLLYHDRQWGCDFFPNHATADNETENVRLLSDYLSTGFDIPKDDFTLIRVTDETHEKYSTEHEENRVYDYTLYKAHIKRMPDAWRSERFHVDSKDCRWMTCDEMLSDETIRRINHDVVSMVRDHA